VGIIFVQKDKDKIKHVNYPYDFATVKYNKGGEGSQFYQWIFQVS